MKISILAACSALLISVASVSTPVFAQQTRDIAKEEANRKLVLEFYDGVFNKHEVEKYSEVLAENYIQHNPGVPDGKAPFVKFFTQRFKDNPKATARIVRSATDGDLVFLHLQSKMNEEDRGRAIVDIFRVDNGKIVEHWDVIQAVPETSKNNNTMF
ncbi:nuclear transport factor 2 family protein [Brucella sp. NBRC 113783]|uniref:nuclear transport factor 2 family protein n=1 Tax=Brucella sp. NBRC 113783 TaxID=3075478 RepID=UPI0029C01C58|nr:nuclear transport factor 2 family protein [Brucella sp. NBRC 113783]MDX4073425.1 ester cyclase [Brucella sp. NBRC 113783]